MFRSRVSTFLGEDQSLFVLIGKALPVPEFSRLSKRMNTSLSALHLRLPLPLSSLDKAGHLIINSTGLKVFGEKEWLETTHGK